MSATEKEAYWRGLVAAAADVMRVSITQFSPDGFRERIGSNVWFFVKLGPLVLRHDGTWRFAEREETTDQRMEYAHRSAAEALTALRKCVAPDEPACAAWT